MSDETMMIDGETFRLADVAADPRHFLALYADRCADLAFECEARMAAERLNDALLDLRAYLQHDDGCDDQTCVCGLTRRDAHAMRLRSTPPPPPTSYARLVALGRAALAYARARRSSTPLSSADGSAQAFRATSIAYQAALKAAEEVPQ